MQFLCAQFTRVTHSNFFSSSYCRLSLFLYKPKKRNTKQYTNSAINQQFIIFLFFLSITIFALLLLLFLLLFVDDYDLKYRGVLCIQIHAMIIMMVSCCLIAAQMKGNSTRSDYELAVTFCKTCRQTLISIIKQSVAVMIYDRLIVSNCRFWLCHIFLFAQSIQISFVWAIQQPIHTLHLILQYCRRLCCECLSSSFQFESHEVDTYLPCL